MRFSVSKGLSLIMGRGATKWERDVKFYPYEKGGGEGKVLAMLKGVGGRKSFGVVSTQ